MGRIDTMNKRLTLMEQIEVLKEYNQERTIKEMKMLLDGMLKYDDCSGVFDVVLVNGINRKTLPVEHIDEIFGEDKKEIDLEYVKRIIQERINICENSLKATGEKKWDHMKMLLEGIIKEIEGKK